MAGNGLPDVWATRDFPVLREVARRIDAGEHTPRVEEVAAATGLDVDEVVLAGQALTRRGLVTVMGAMGHPVLRFSDVAGEAYLMTGLHPDGDDAITQLVSALRGAAEKVEDPAEKGRLRNLADGALGISRDVLTGVLTAVITAQAR